MPVRTHNDSSRNLLPPNAAKFERDLLSVVPFDAVLNPLLPRITSSKLTDIPDVVVPWLLIEYGLGSFTKYQTNARTLLEEGVLLNRLKGTVAGLKIVLGWVGFPNAEIIEETEPGLHFAEWQIDLGRVPNDLRELCDVAEVVRLVQPMRSRLRRVFHGYNVGRFMLDDSDWGDILGNYSGEWSEDFPNLCKADPQLWISLGRNYLSGVIGPIIPDLNAAVSSFYEREMEYWSFIAYHEWPSLDDDYPHSFYPKTGVVSSTHTREWDDPDVLTIDNEGDALFIDGDPLTV